MIVFITTSPRETDQTNIFTTIQNLFNVVLKKEKRNFENRIYKIIHREFRFHLQSEREDVVSFTTASEKSTMGWKFKKKEEKKRKKNPTFGARL